MLDKFNIFLRKNILTILLAFLPPIAMWYFIEQESSDLSVTVNSQSSVISLDNNFSDGIKIFHNDMPIDGLYVADITIKNEGNQPIEKDDFDQQLTIEFNGNIIKPIKLVSTKPSGLPVITKVSDNKLIIEPLLLNPDDTFHIQTKIVNPSKKELTIEPTARIKSIKEIKFNPYTKGEDPIYLFTMGAISTIILFISLISAQKLFKQIKLVSISIPGATIELTRELESNDKISHRMENLANQLSISGHDFKSNILLFRLKIENQLRDLANIYKLNIRNQGSISFLSRHLFEHNIIDRKVVSIIQDISPAMNRELHESTTYLNEEEFEVLQHAALSVIASLEESFEKIQNQNNLTSVSTTDAVTARDS